MEDANQENGPFIPKSPEIQTYHRRWYILGQFAFFGLLQNVVWNTFGPILNSTIKAFGWTLGEIALIPNIGNISMVITLPLGSWFVSKCGKYYSRFTVMDQSAIMTIISMLFSVGLKAIQCATAP